MALTQPRQIALTDLDRALSQRIETLRESCKFMSKSLRTRTEMRLASMSASARQQIMREILANGKPKKELAHQDIPPPGNGKRKAEGSPTKSPPAVVKKGRTARPAVQTTGSQRLVTKKGRKAV